MKEWQERPLEEVYAVVFMDAIHYHVRSEGRIVKRAVYIALGIDMDGRKDVLGMYVEENERYSSVSSIRFVIPRNLYPTRISKS